MTLDQMKALRLARGRHTKALRDLSRILREVFPIGSTVCWKRGRGIRTGTVLGSSFPDLIIASDRATGKEVSVDSYEIIKAGDGRPSE